MAEKDYPAYYPTSYPIYPKDYQTEWYPTLSDYPQPSYAKAQQGSFEAAFLLSDPPLSGGIEAYLYEEKPPGVAPTNIIRTGTPWGVKIHWYLEGPLTCFICGWWCLNLYFEGMGSPKGYPYAPKGEEYGTEGSEYPYPEQEEFDLPAEVNIPLNPCLKLDEYGRANYCYDFKIPGDVIKPGHCGRPYIVTVALTYKTVCGEPGPMAGHVKLGMVQFYDSKGSHSYGKK